MNNSFLIAKRILKQLRHDPRFVFMSILAPTLITFLLHVFVESLPPGFPTERYIMPMSSYIVHFISFILSMIILVQERRTGTLERMFINGVRKIEVVVGYLLGYLLLATLQTVIVLVEVILLFKFQYNFEQLALISVATWLLSMASVSLGLFLSSFARHEGHIIPFIPLIALPTVFLSGLIVDFERLPEWGQFLGRFTPMHYANNLIQPIIRQTYDISNYYFYNDYFVLIGMTIIFLILTSLTIREEVV